MHVERGGLVVGVVGQKSSRKSSACFCFPSRTVSFRWFFGNGEASMVTRQGPDTERALQAARQGSRTGWTWPELAEKIIGKHLQNLQNRE